MDPAREPAVSVVPDDKPDAQAGHWVELRVHGVSGTPPESILMSSFVRQVGGDDRARFFRPADSLGNERQQEEGRVLEAYHWGRFTSGSWTQALWLLIVPFGVVNTAFFTLPRAAGGIGRMWWHLAAATLRLLGLALTCLLVFSSVIVGMDLFGWQRQGAGLGDGLQWWLVLGAALPVGAVVLFFFFGKIRQAGQNPNTDGRTAPGAGGAESSTTPESGDPPAVEPQAPAAPQAGCEARMTVDAQFPDSTFADQEFFSGDPDAPILRRLHAAAPLAMVAAMLVWPQALTGGTVADVVRWTALSLLAGSTVSVIMLGDRPDGPRSGWSTPAGWLSHLLFWAGWLVVGTAAGVVWFAGSAGSPDTGGGMPGIAGAAFVLLGVIVAALVVLLIATFGLALATRPGQGELSAKHRAYRRFAGGMTPFLLASVGAHLGIGFAGAFAFASQGVLNTAGSGVTVTRIVQRAAYAWGLTVLLIGAMIVVIICLYVVRRAHFAHAARTAFDLAAAATDGLPPAWINRVARTLFLARLKNLLPAVFWIFSCVGLVLALAAGIAQWLPEPLAGAAADSVLLGWLSGLSGGTDGWLVWLGTWALTALSAMLVFLGRGAVKAERMRRGVNVVWDVIAFWPRAVHPFVPPPYSQQVVAALRRRISWHLGTLDDPSARPPAEPADRLVVAAHSQGSLITVAALVWLTPEERDRVGLVTFGSQLRQQFARAFPASVNLGLLEWMSQAYGGRWRNLYRDTDPIGGPVLSWDHRSVTDPGTPASERLEGDDGRQPDGIDPDTGRRSCGAEWRLLDPPRTDLALMAGAMDKLRGHGDYPADPDWSLAIAEVLPMGRNA